nr:MAG TPA: Chromatin remodeling complex ATPase [Caudoviricetes sp.]
MGLKLFDFQREAVKRALSSLNYLLCVRVGGGKTLIAMVYAKLLRKYKHADKIAFACTVSAAVAVAGEFKEKLNMDVPVITDVDKYLEWLQNDEPVCIFKHSFFEKLGYDQNVLDSIESILDKNGKKVALVIDEAHKLSNDKGVAHTAYMNVKFSFCRVLLLTATPYSTCVSQMYGLLQMIQPRLWKSKAEFMRLYVEEQIVRVNGKVRMKEKVAYKNLTDLRARISPYTFFYYPKIKLNFFYHNVKLPDYTEYDDICKGVLTENELERINKP